MQVSSRARLAWANRNIEEAADIIVADYLRSLAERRPDRHDANSVLREIASEMDPEGES